MQKSSYFLNVNTVNASGFNEHLKREILAVSIPVIQSSL